MCTHRPLKHRFAADREALPLARILVRHWLAEGGYSPEIADDVLFVANELCTHALQACPGGFCQLDGSDDGTGILLTVSGQASRTAHRERVVHLAPGSPGYELLHRLCDRVEVLSGSDPVLASCRCPKSQSGSGIPAA